MTLSESTWGPFQSPAVREICAHLTDAEKQRLGRLAGDYGRQTAWRFALPVSLLVFSFFYWPAVGWALLLPSIIYCIVLWRRHVQAHQQRVREFLAFTEFAKKHGYRPETLKLFALPWRR